MAVVQDSVIQEASVYEELVENYQEEKTEAAFAELYQSVQTYLGRLAKQMHKKVVGYGVSEETVRQEIDIALWKATEKFDGTQGSNFISYLKQYVRWRVSDYIIRPFYSEKNKANRDSLSLDDTDIYGDTILDQQEFKETGGNGIMMEVKELVEQFQSYGTEADYKVVKIVFGILLSKGNADNDTVNQALYDEFPDLAKSSVRAKKNRGLNKFKEFCELDGSEINIEEIL